MLNYTFIFDMRLHYRNESKMFKNLIVLDRSLREGERGGGVGEVGREEK